MELLDHNRQELVDTLPMKNEIFLADLIKHNLFSEDESPKWRSLPISAERASYLLNKINTDNVKDFSKLINLMGKSKNKAVVELSIKIKSEQTCNVIIQSLNQRTLCCII